MLSTLTLQKYIYTCKKERKIDCFSLLVDEPPTDLKETCAEEDRAEGKAIAIDAPQGKKNHEEYASCNSSYSEIIRSYSLAIIVVV